MARQKLGSMTYQVSHINIDLTKHTKRGEGVLSPQSLKQYRQHAIKFGEWCKANYGVKAFVDCKPYIQQYGDHLAAEGKSASTVHTYLAAVCRFFDVNLGTIKKPRRVCAENRRSRGQKKSDARRSASREASPRLYDFALKVGIRRAEYGHLFREDFTIDESGYPCVFVAKGKGGKKQLQRIELEGREKLAEEIRARWAEYNSAREWKDSVIREKPYYIRGKNKELAIAHGLPLVYDRLALMAVSVFHLSHWRLDVTVSNYLLAVG